VTMKQLVLFGEAEAPAGARRYQPALTAFVNRKGVLDVDTVKGCTMGMRAYPNGGCYGECYANKEARRNGIDFTVSVSREIQDIWCHKGTIVKQLLAHDAPWYRIGVAGDPCHDWDSTIGTINLLRRAGKTAVIITKHWTPLSDDHISRLMDLRVVVNTSTSGMDTDAELAHRVGQLERLRRCGIGSVCRVVTCQYGESDWARACKEKQEYLLSLVPVIDNPLRVSPLNPHVVNGDIITTCREDSVGGGTLVSLHDPSAYLGKCHDCPDQCGFDSSVAPKPERGEYVEQIQLFEEKAEFIHVESVIGSGYEAAVSQLALEDGIAHRAARKNMQIHSAIILLVNGEFAGFFTFQNNHEVREFCLLQSVIRPDKYSDKLYRDMAEQVVSKNTNGYPALMTTNPKSKFETPALFESLGFKTYLKMSGFHYMALGDASDVRMKILAHITMTNVWDPNKADWLRLKKEWNERINYAGAMHSVSNPLFASREGCWQGVNGFANVVTGHSHNGNASVLDPVACEVVLRFFMPKNGKRVYNPFGGGVQFGYVTGAYGFEYVASELRKNQCDANNSICSDFTGVTWVQSDSATYEPEGMFDLVFACPPYYRVERYVDYDGNAPDGEINSLGTYAEFRDALFTGYRNSIDHLNDGCFFVIMTGDSRDAKGAYYCSEAETELFMRDAGLSVYDRIVYLESEFTRLAHAKKTLNMRKFPKREQKIIAAYKGDISKIKDNYAKIGRL